MTPEMKFILDWIELHRPELAKSICREVLKGDMVYITLLTIGFEAGKASK